MWIFLSMHWRKRSANEVVVYFIAHHHPSHAILTTLNVAALLFGRSDSAQHTESKQENIVAEYIPTEIDWVREQIELYESSGGKEGTTLKDTGLPCIIITHIGRKTGAIRKTALMRVKVGEGYVLIGSNGGSLKNPVWVSNFRAKPDVEIRDATDVSNMRIREVHDDAERKRLWQAGAEAFPPYNEYQAKTPRAIPIFIAEPV